MPTGYTADVVNGKIDTFEKFALQCARAFGALILMRDDPWDAAIPEKFEPGDYNLKKLIEIKRELKRLQSLTTEQIEAQCEAEYAAKIASNQKYLADARAENERIAAMEAKVEAWEPPTANHTEMKSFMLEQLRISRHDMAWLEKYEHTERLTPSDWHRQKVEEAHRSIGYHAGEHEKEIERCEGRTTWVKQLRDSLLRETAP